MKRRSFLKGGLILAAAPLLLLTDLTEGHAAPIQDPPEPAVVGPTEHLRAMVESPDNSSKCDPLGQYGYVAYKVCCRSCLRQWGEFEKFSSEVVDRGLFRVPTEDEARTRAVAHLDSLAWSFGPGYTPTCPSCRGFHDQLNPLREGVLPKSTPWYTHPA